jgi:hypothetical protein
MQEVGVSVLLMTGTTSAARDPRRPVKSVLMEGPTVGIIWPSYSFARFRIVTTF